MGSIVKFERPRPVIRQPRAKATEDQESVEARRSLFILIGSFFVTAIIMCAAVVALVSTTWTDVLLMSAFVLVFAILKIVLANALIYTMLRYDATTADVPAPPGIERYRSFYIRQPRSTKKKPAESLKTRKLWIATGKVETTTS